MSEASAKSVLSSLRQDFPTVRFIFEICDVSKWEDQKTTFEKTFQEFEHIDVVIANAGISEKGNFLDIDPGEPVKPTITTLDVNLTGMLYSKSTNCDLYATDLPSCQIRRSLSTQKPSSAEGVYNLYLV